MSASAVNASSSLSEIATAVMSLPTAQLTPELQLQPTLPALRLVEGGMVVVGQSKVSFDLVVEEYLLGSSAEQIVEAYDTLALSDVHQAIAYYLEHAEQVKTYMDRRAAENLAIRKALEARSPKAGKEELLKRKRARESGNAEASN